MSKKTEYNIKPNLEQLNLEWFSKQLKKYLYDDETATKACLALEESLSNIVHHSGTNKPILLNVIYSRNQIKIRLADEGKKFNPLKDYKPKQFKSIEDFKTGGLGIHLTRSIARDMSYARSGRYNVLTITIKASSLENANHLVDSAKFKSGTVYFHK